MESHSIKHVIFRTHLNEALEGFKGCRYAKKHVGCGGKPAICCFLAVERSMSPPTKAIFNPVESLNWSIYALIESSHFSEGSRRRLITVCGSFKLTTAIFETSDS